MAKEDTLPIDNRDFLAERKKNEERKKSESFKYP